MKFFLQEIRRAWSPIRWTRPIDKYTLKYYLKQFIIRTNDDLANICMKLISSPGFFVYSASSVVLTIMLPSFVSSRSLLNLLLATSTLILGFLSLFFAVGIYVSTLALQLSTKNSEVSNSYRKQLEESRGVLKAVYDLVVEKVSVDDNLALLRGVCASDVVDMDSYREFKNWYKDKRNSINVDDIPTEEHYSLYPYDLIVQSISSRTYFLKEAVQVAIEQLKLLNQRYRELYRDKLDQLRSNANNFESSGISAFYAQRDFIEQRLSRFVTFAFIFVSLSGLNLVLQDSSHNFIRSINLHTTELLPRITLIVMMPTLYLAYKYITNFIIYLRFNGAYDNSGINNTNQIWPEGEEGEWSGSDYSGYNNGSMG